MSEQVGIKETKELLVGVLQVAQLLIERFKDGFQMEDLPVILSKLGFDPKFQEAMKGLNQLPKEVKDIDLNEGVELMMVLLVELPKILGAAKKA